MREDLGAHLVRPDRNNEPARHGIARYRQWIEAIFDTLKGQLTLEDHGARTLAGVYARVRPRLLALAAAIRHLADQRHQQALADRLRPLIQIGLTHLVRRRDDGTPLVKREGEGTMRLGRLDGHRDRGHR